MVADCRVQDNPDWRSCIKAVDAFRPSLRKGVRKHALVLYGGVTGLTGPFDPAWAARQRVATTDVNVSLVAALFRFNLIVGGASDASTDISFDTFIHTWSHELADTLAELYDPVSILAEDNRMYTDELQRVHSSLKNELQYSIEKPSTVAQVSMALTMSKALGMLIHHQRSRGLLYDSVFLTRPDILLKKKVRLDRGTAIARIRSVFFCIVVFHFCSDVLLLFINCSA